ncbi:UNVERIFIED_CONTAM: BRCA1 C Terminus (BRCT) domain-containing protein [Hammondia hammondi]|eukprot:XP_008885407.1 BRCA1 C Terminus (BRCT) domain-containing protein [Hammondia hammondi]
MGRGHGFFGGGKWNSYGEYFRHKNEKMHQQMHNSLRQHRQRSGEEQATFSGDSEPATRRRRDREEAQPTGSEGRCKRRKGDRAAADGSSPTFSRAARVSPVLSCVPPPPREGSYSISSTEKTDGTPPATCSPGFIPGLHSSPLSASSSGAHTAYEESQYARRVRELLLNENDACKLVNPSLFKNCVFYVDGDTLGMDDICFKKLLLLFGGRICMLFGKGCTHIIAETVAMGNQRWRHLREQGGEGKKYVVVTVKWVFECIDRGKLLPASDFRPQELQTRQRYASNSIASFYASHRADSGGRRIWGKGGVSASAEKDRDVQVAASDRSDDSEQEEENRGEEGERETEEQLEGVFAFEAPDSVVCIDDDEDEAELKGRGDGRQTEENEGGQRAEDSEREEDQGIVELGSQGRQTTGVSPWPPSTFRDASTAATASTFSDSFRHKYSSSTQLTSPSSSSLTEKAAAQSFTGTLLAGPASLSSCSSSVSWRPPGDGFRSPLSASPSFSPSRLSVEAPSPSKLPSPESSKRLARTDGKDETAVSPFPSHSRSRTERSVAGAGSPWPSRILRPQHPSFVSSFFENSRLHFIGRWRTRCMNTLATILSKECHDRGDSDSRPAAVSPSSRSSIPFSSLRLEDRTARPGVLLPFALPLLCTPPENLDVAVSAEAAAAVPMPPGSSSSSSSFSRVFSGGLLERLFLAQRGAGSFGAGEQTKIQEGETTCRGGDDAEAEGEDEKRKEGGVVLRGRIREQTRGEKGTEKESEMQLRWILHVDFDAFFVAVALKKRPHLKNFPVAVAHSRGSGGKTASSTSEVASCNYTARARGVYKGQWLGEAKERCPGLITLPYDFDGIEEASEGLFACVLQLSRRILPVSCDETYVQLLLSPTNGESDKETEGLADGSASGEVETAILDACVELRQRVFERTGCWVSIGAGPNLLAAKLAGLQAKPKASSSSSSSSSLSRDGVCVIRPRESFLWAFMEHVPLRKLPGVGSVLGGKVEKAGRLRLCGQVMKEGIRSLRVLQNLLGRKRGAIIWWMAHGCDPRPLPPFSPSLLTHSASSSSPLSHSSSLSSSPSCRSSSSSSSSHYLRVSPLETGGCPSTLPEPSSAHGTIEGRTSPTVEGADFLAAETGSDLCFFSSFHPSTSLPSVVSPSSSLPCLPPASSSSPSCSEESLAAGATAVPSSRSLTISVNWGIRLHAEKEVFDLLRQLAGEAHKRLRMHRLVAPRLGLKICRRREGVPVETEKFLGAGVCDVLSGYRLCSEPVPAGLAALLLESQSVPSVSPLSPLGGLQGSGSIETETEAWASRERRKERTSENERKATAVQSEADVFRELAALWISHFQGACPPEDLRGFNVLLLSLRTESEQEEMEAAERARCLQLRRQRHVMDNFLSLCSAPASASGHPGKERPDVVVVSSQDSSEDVLAPTRAGTDSAASAGSTNEKQRMRKKEEEEEKGGREKVHAEKAAKEDEGNREEEAREQEKEEKEVEDGADEKVKNCGDGEQKDAVGDVVEIESQTSMAGGAESEEGLGERRNSMEEGETAEGDAYPEGGKRKARTLERQSPSRQSASFLCEAPRQKSLFPEPTILSPLTRRTTFFSSPTFAPPPVPSSSASSSSSSSPSPSSSSSSSPSPSSRSSLPAARSSSFACEVQSPPFEKAPFSSQASPVSPGKSPFSATPRCDERGRRGTSRPERETARPGGDRQKRISASASLDAFLSSRRLSSSPQCTPQPRRHSPGGGAGSGVCTPVPSLGRVLTPSTPATVVLSPLSTRGNSGRSARSSLDVAEFDEGTRTARSSFLSFRAKSPVSVGRDARRKREGPRGREDGKQQLLLPLLAEQRECRRERRKRSSAGFREIVSLLNDEDSPERGRPAETMPRSSPHTTGGAAAGAQGDRDTFSWSPTSAGHRVGEGEGPLMLWGRVESEDAKGSPETGEGESEKGQSKETHAMNNSSAVPSLEAPASLAQEGDWGRREEANREPGQAKSGTSSPSNQVINVADEDEESDEEAEAQEAPGGVCTLEKGETEEGELFHSAREEMEEEGRREEAGRQTGNAGGRLEGESVSRLSSHPRLDCGGNERFPLSSKSHVSSPSVSPPLSRLGCLAGSSERLKPSSSCTSLSPGSSSSRCRAACRGSPTKEGARGRVRRPRFSRVRRQLLRALEDLWRENEVLQKIGGFSGEAKLLLSRIAGKVLVLGLLTAGQWAAAACATDGEVKTFDKEQSPLAEKEGETSRERPRERPRKRFRDGLDGEGLVEAGDGTDRKGRKQERKGALDNTYVGRSDTSFEPFACPPSSSASDVRWRAEFLRGFQRGLEEARAFCVSRASHVHFQDSPASRVPPSLAFLSCAVYRRARRGAALALAAREAAQQMAAVETQWTDTREGRRRGLAGDGQPLSDTEERTDAEAKIGGVEDQAGDEARCGDEERSGDEEEATDTRVGEGENREETDEANRVVKGRRRSFKVEAEKTSRAPNRRGKGRKEDGFSEKKEAGEQEDEEEQEEEDEQEEEEEEREQLEWALSRELLAFLGGREKPGDPDSRGGGARIERSRETTKRFQQSRCGEERMHLFHESSGCTTPEEAEGKTTEEREEGENHHGGKDEGEIGGREQETGKKDHWGEKESETEEGRKKEGKTEESESPDEERARELLGLTKVLPPHVSLCFNFSMFRFLSQSRVC